MKKMTVSFLIYLISVQVIAGGGFSRESVYSNKICEELFHGKATALESGIRPDCETEFAVVEFDWAKSPKHYECLGQALIYASETKKMPVCVLLARDSKEMTFGYSVKRKENLGGVKVIVINVLPGGKY